MRTLDEIMIEYGADKASKHPVGAHNYAVHYDRYFTPLREEEIKVLEIGVGSGPSIQAWLEYFPRAQVFGVDKVNTTNKWNTVKANTHPRYTFVTGDQSDPTFWKCFVADYGTDWGVIIDDGGHYADQIITSFNSMWPHIMKAGLYCIEDLLTAYGELFVPKGWENHMQFIKGKLDAINKGSEIAALHFSKELAILEKAAG